MKILNAIQLKAGAKTKSNQMGVFIQPVQFLPRDEKTEEWACWNMDFYEWQGLKQIALKAPRLMKNFKLAKGIIDKSDYIISDDNEYSELIDTLTEEDSSAFELKFYPIVPNVINTMCTEFAERTAKIGYNSIDEHSNNDKLEQKRLQIEQTLLADAEKKMWQNLIDQGLDPDDPSVQEEIAAQMSPENLKTLPEIESFFRKDYLSVIEEWAGHQHSVDTERFRMDELEERNFRNMLITDSEFWHFRMMEDDYDIEIWNPVLTFYNKSPENRYISQGSMVGKSEMLTVSGVIDKYGPIMTQEQMESLEAIYPIMSAAYNMPGVQNDGSFYDTTKSHEWNTHTPSLAYRQFTSAYVNSAFGGDIVKWVMSESEDYHLTQGMNYMLRCTTVYWKSQRKVGHLTKIKESGEVLVDIVDEDYRITDKPVYNNTLIKNKNAETLLFGEHIEWIWINQVWGGVKIGPNMPSYWGMQNVSGISPIYLGIDQNHIGPLKFQFRGDKTLYGCKLPVEGAVFSDYNTKSFSLVDAMKPFQISYNLVNNQISDILVDELGTVILLDQNYLPKHSLGEDWGKGNYAKAYGAMKQFQVLPLDGSAGNMEGPSTFNQFTKLDLEQSSRLMTRVSLANYFKQQAFEVIGLTPQRLGQQTGRQTATGVEENMNASYAQTENYFIQHCDYLMPRVHQMRTDLAQFYQSNNPSLRLQYVTSTEEKVNFSINGTDLLLADFNVYSSTKASNRSLLERLQKLAIDNNTTGTSIYDLGSILKADSIASLDNIFKGIEQKADKVRKEQYDHEQKLKQMDLEAQQRDQQLERDEKARIEEQRNRKDVLVAEIRAAGYMGMADQDKNQQSDYIDYMNDLTKSSEFQQTMTMEQTKESNKTNLNSQKLALDREKLATQVALKNKDLQIATVNKNKFDKPGKTTKKK
jgi:hypothetical protein